MKHETGALTHREEGGADAGAGLAERYALVRERVAEAARRSGRGAGDVVLIVVTKQGSMEQIRKLIRLGHVDFGENRAGQLMQRAAMVEEWLGRCRGYRSGVKAGGEVAAPEDVTEFEAEGWGPERVPEGVRWHMIGSLQRNKVKKLLPHVRLIHSVDSLRLAEEIQTTALRQDRVADVLLQVNASLEEQKHGCLLPAAPYLAEQIETMANLRLRGLMTMAAEVSKGGTGGARGAFSRTRELFLEIRKEGICGESFNVLSMGMSGDYEIAIEEGANMVRVGSAVIGTGAPVGAAEGEEEEPDGDDEGDEGEGGEE